MTGVNRWRAAQRYERSYWQQVAGEIGSGAVSQLDWYAWRADQLRRRFARLGLPHLTSAAGDLLEIGAGPVGIIAYLPGKIRVAVDPLEPFYGRDPVLTRLRPPAVRYVEGMGEHLPLPAESVDVAIIDNCIDHVCDVGRTMAEIARVLRPGGVLYLSVNCRTPWGFVLHRLLSRLRVDAGHPHTFTPGRARALLAGRPLRLLEAETESATAARAQDWAAPGLRGRLKALLGTSEFATHLVAVRDGGPCPAEPRGAAAGFGD